MSMILWRLARIEDALARQGLLEPFPVPFFRVLISSDKGYFVSRNREGRIESEELDGPIFAENDANKLVDALKTKDGYLTCKKVQAGKINEDYDVSTFDQVWNEE
jgi:hypothetical protein